MGTREFEILRKEGRLLTVLHVTFAHFKDAWCSLTSNFAHVLSEESGGLDGPNREQILFLGGLLLQRHEGLKLVNTPFRGELRQALLEEGLLVDCLRLGLLKATSSTSVFSTAIEQGVRDEAELPPETQEKINSRRKDQLAFLYQHCERTGSKSRFDHQYLLFNAFKRTGFNPRGELRGYFTGIVENIINTGRLHSLLHDKVAREVLDILHEESRLAPLLMGYIIKLEEWNEGQKCGTQATYEEELTRYLQS